MEQKKDLWELVRQKLEKNNEPVIESPNNEEPENLVEPNNPSPAIVSVTKITFSLDSNRTYSPIILWSQTTCK